MVDTYRHRACTMLKKSSLLWILLHVSIFCSGQAFAYKGRAFLQWTILCLINSRNLKQDKPAHKKLKHFCTHEAIAYEAHSWYSINALCTTLAYTITNALQSCCCLLLQKIKKIFGVKTSRNSWRSGSWDTSPRKPTMRSDTNA